MNRSADVIISNAKQNVEEGELVSEIKCVN